MDKRQQYIVCGLVVLVAVVLLNLPDQQAGRLKLALGGLFLPFFGAAASAQRLADGAAQALAPRSALQRRIEQLQKENDDLRLRLAQAEQVLHENVRLREALGWSQRTSRPFKLASVVGQDPANWWRSLHIDIGSRDGVRANMTVLVPEGIVGRVSEAGLARSRVTLVGDPSFRFSAQVLDGSDQRVVARGAISPSTSSLNRSLVNLIFLPGDSLIKPGQMVVTSGEEGGVFARGIPVGRIVDVRTNDFGIDLEARVKLSVNLNRLEEVWVLMQ